MKLEKAESRDWKVAHLKSGYSLDVMHDDPLDNICQMISDLIAIYNGDTVALIDGELRKLTRANRSAMHSALSVHLQDLFEFAKDQNMLEFAGERLECEVEKYVDHPRATGAQILNTYYRISRGA